jgi:hypothetical protein
VVAFIIKTLSGEPMRRRRGVPPHLPYWIKCRGLEWLWICQNHDVQFWFW